MKIAYFVMLSVIATGVAAADFAARVKEGNDAIATLAGKKYDSSLGTAIQSVMLKCVPPGSSGHIGKFALVGAVSNTGVVSGIEVQPSTETSQCFAEQFRGVSLPAPPFAPYPLTVEMTVSP